MQIVWNNKRAEFGYYDMWVEDDNGQKLDCTELWLQDNTCDYQQRDPWRDSRKKEIDFEWCWCHGWSHSESYKHEEHLTLEQAKRRAERWVLQRYIDGYADCLKSIERLKPLAEWAEKEIERQKEEEE